jgi:hypothetical protein
VRRSEVAVLETVEPDSTGAHTGSRCDHVYGGPTTSVLMCSVAVHLGAVKIVALATSRNPGGLGPMRNQVLPDGHRAVPDLSRMCLRFAMNCVFALRTIGRITGDASLIAGGKRRSTVLVNRARRRPRP